jgi:GH24 family phage-related lysozyme (muramidase)
VAVAVAVAVVIQPLPSTFIPIRFSLALSSSRSVQAVQKRLKYQKDLSYHSLETKHYVYHPHTNTILHRQGNKAHARNIYRYGHSSLRKSTNRRRVNVSAYATARLRHFRITNQKNLSRRSPSYKLFGKPEGNVL